MIIVETTKTHQQTVYKSNKKVKKSHVLFLPFLFVKNVTLEYNLNVVGKNFNSDCQQVMGCTALPSAFQRKLWLEKMRNEIKCCTVQNVKINFLKKFEKQVRLLIDKIPLIEVLTSIKIIKNSFGMTNAEFDEAASIETTLVFIAAAGEIQCHRSMAELVRQLKASIWNKPELEGSASFWNQKHNFLIIWENWGHKKHKQQN